MGEIKKEKKRNEVGTKGIKQIQKYQGKFHYILSL